MLGMSVAASSVSFGEQSRMIVDLGLGAASLCGAAMAIALSISTNANDFTLGRAHLVLARPISRGTFLVGRFLGLWLTMAVVVTTMVCSAAAIVWLYGDEVPVAMWGGLWLTVVEMAVVLAIGMLFSTLAIPSLAATYSVGMVLGGNLAGDIQTFATAMVARGDELGSVLRLAYYLLPDLQDLSLRAAAANAMPIPAGVVQSGTIYGLSYTAFLLLLAGLSLSRRRAL